VDTSGAWKWIKTAVIAMLGGGLAGGLSALFDPSKYNFPRDLGSGKLWKYVFMGWGLTLGGLLIKSPLGKQVTQAYRDSQAQLEADREAFEKIKAALTEKDKETEP
jgi:hypothetical protein